MSRLLQVTQWVLGRSSAWGFPVSGSSLEKYIISFLLLCNKVASILAIYNNKCFLLHTVPEGRDLGSSGSGWQSSEGSTGAGSSASKLLTWLLTGGLRSLGFLPVMFMPRQLASPRASSLRERVTKMKAATSFYHLS